MCPQNASPRLIRRHVAFVKLELGVSHDATSHDGAPTAGDASHPEPVRKRRPITPNKMLAASTDEKEANAVKYLSEALQVSYAEAKGLSSRGLKNGHDNPLMAENCRGWVGYLAHLADGDMSLVKTSMSKSPRLLRCTFDEGRKVDLHDLESYLDVTLQLNKKDMMKMAVKRSGFLQTPAKTVQAMVKLLLRFGGGDIAVLREALVVNPELLTLSVPAVQAKLSWLTDKVGLAPSFALKRALVHASTSSIVNVLEPRRLWMLEQGFSKDQVTNILKNAPGLLIYGVAKLGRHLDSIAKDCSMDAGTVRQMVARLPSLWGMEWEGELMQLKRQYWTQDMGYILNDLQYAPNAMTASFNKLAMRSAAVRDLLGLRLSAKEFKRALFTGNSDSDDGFGPRFFRKFMRTSLKGGTVQDVLRPLAARLHDPESQNEWQKALVDAPLLSTEGKSTPEHRQLYSQLSSVFFVDWLKSPAGVTAVDREKAAKRADVERREGVFSAKAASRISQKEEQRRVTRASKSSQGV